MVLAISRCVMDDVSTPGDRYKSLKERLWNQPRPRQILERLEQHHASPPMLETVAQTFMNGRHGEAEIRSAIYGELLRNRDRTAVLKRVGDLRQCLTKIQQDLSYVARDARPKGRTELPIPGFLVPGCNFLKYVVIPGGASWAESAFSPKTGFSRRASER